MTIVDIVELLEQAKIKNKCGAFNEAEQLVNTVLDASELHSSIHIDAMLTMAGITRMQGNFDNALLIAEKALSIAEECNYEASKAEAWRIIGSVSYFVGSYDKALEFYHKALSLLEKLEINTGIADINGNIGTVYFSIGSYESALRYFATALSIHEKLGAKSGIASIMVNIGNVYLNLGSCDRALEYYINALTVHEELREKARIANVLGNIGNVYCSLGSYNTALKYYIHALSLHEELGVKPEIAHVLANIGSMYQNLDSYDKALEYYSRSLVIHKELGAQSEVACITGNIGVVYYSLHLYDLALEAYSSALDIHKKLEEKSDVALVTGNIAILYQDIALYDEAMKYYTKALALHEELGEKSSSANVTGNIGELYAEKNFAGYDPQKAKVYLQNAILANNELGAKHCLYSNYLELSKVFKQSEMWQEAQMYFEKYHELYTEVQNEEVKKQADRFGWERKIAEMEKQKEIDLLKTEAEKLSMRQKIEFQAREVENTIHELIKKNDLLQQVQSGILKIKPHTKGEAIAHIEQLLDRVTRNITPLESISELDKQWTEVHKNFMDKLKGSFPDLTAMELKIAALLTMKLTSSNIASVLFLSKRTVESHRHSLRKKMGISVTDDVYNVLALYSAQ